ncbi:seizure protein 6 homolog isoform X1 [Tachysurus ichikawai]
MVSTILVVTLCVTLMCIHVTTGAAFLTPDSEAPPTMTSDPRPLGELLHAALMSKKYLGQSSGNIGTTTNPTQAVPSVEPASTVMSPGVLTTAMTSSTAPKSGQLGGKGGVTSPPLEEETTTTLITTTTITTVHTPGLADQYSKILGQLPKNRKEKHSCL